MSRIENPMAQDELLLYRLYRIHATAAPLVVRMCEQEYGITRREWRILSSLVNREGVLSSELASIAMLDRARTSRNLTRLAQKNLVLRVPKPSDRREVHIYLTDEGRRTPTGVARSADPARTEYGTNDFLLYLIVDNNYWDTAFDRSMVEKDLLERFTTKGMDGGEDVLTGYEKATVLTTTGFIYEAVIPWSNFSNSRIPVYTPAAGDTVNFDFAITDISYPCPGTEYIPQMAWTGTLDINTNPSLWGRLTFAE